MRLHPRAPQLLPADRRVWQRRTGNRTSTTVDEVRANTRETATGVTDHGTDHGHARVDDHANCRDGRRIGGGQRRSAWRDPALAGTRRIARAVRRDRRGAGRTGDRARWRWLRDRGSRCRARRRADPGHGDWCGPGPRDARSRSCHRADRADALGRAGAPRGSLDRAGRSERGVTFAAGSGAGHACAIDPRSRRPRARDRR